jgi:hypothetical protein
VQLASMGIDRIRWNVVNLLEIMKQLASVLLMLWFCCIVDAVANVKRSVFVRTP